MYLVFPKTFTEKETQTLLWTKCHFTLNKFDLACQQALTLLFHAVFCSHLRVPIHIKVSSLGRSSPAQCIFHIFPSHPSTLWTYWICNRQHPFSMHYCTHRPGHATPKNHQDTDIFTYLKIFVMLYLFAAQTYMNNVSIYSDLALWQLLYCVWSAVTCRTVSTNLSSLKIKIFWCFKVSNLYFNVYTSSVQQCFFYIDSILMTKTLYLRTGER